jgi:hypothetical protein
MCDIFIMCFVLFLFVTCFGWNFNAIAAAAEEEEEGAATAAIALKFHPKHVTNKNNLPPSRRESPL